VAPAARRRGVGRELLFEALRRSSALRIDLLAQEGSEDFYRSLPHRESTGFRIVADAAHETDRCNADNTLQ
jgi:hypothetical protein